MPSFGISLNGGLNTCPFTLKIEPNSGEKRDIGRVGYRPVNDITSVHITSQTAPCLARIPYELPGLARQLPPPPPPAHTSRLGREAQAGGFGAPISQLGEALTLSGGHPNTQPSTPLPHSAGKPLPRSRPQTLARTRPGE